jgi:hypothetical protein
MIVGTDFRIGKQRLTKQNNVFTCINSMCQKCCLRCLYDQCLLYKQSVDVPLYIRLLIGQMLYHTIIIVIPKNVCKIDLFYRCIKLLKD